MAWGLFFFFDFFTGRGLETRGWRAGSRGNRQGGREAGRQGGREAGRQGGREAGRQGGRQRGTERLRKTERNILTKKLDG